MEFRFLFFRGVLCILTLFMGCQHCGVTSSRSVPCEKFQLTCFLRIKLTPQCFRARVNIYKNSYKTNTNELSVHDAVFHHLFIICYRSSGFVSSLYFCITSNGVTCLACQYLLVITDIVMSSVRATLGTGDLPYAGWSTHCQRIPGVKVPHEDVVEDVVEDAVKDVVEDVGKIQFTTEVRLRVMGTRKAL